MLENLLAIAGIAVIVLGIAELAGWPVGLIVLGVLLVAVAFALHTQAGPTAAGPDGEPTS